ncbi:MAG: MBL fold metallo-hydrolase [Candidatus Vogelbacteria bacterium]|nr:MBL fold metallo-hydrolase [Candidatus Vogelbacteria bacterium]
MKNLVKKVSSHWRKCLILFLISANLIVWYATFRENRAGILTIAFLDVGQGDGIFIEAPNGNQLLLDGGPDKKVLESLGEVMAFYDRTIDVLVLSHPHSDHVAGLDEVLQRYIVGVGVTSGTGGVSSEFTLWKNLLENFGVKKIVAKRGMRINMGGGVYLDALLPSHDVAKETPHDGMLVMQLHYGKTAVMLTGDMERPLEQYLVAYDGAKLKSDILKVGHHGSKTSSTESFVGYVSPRYAVISSGIDNKYGHPAKETLNILEKFEIQTLRTDEDGTIVFESDGETISLK